VNNNKILEIITQLLVIDRDHYQTNIIYLQNRQNLCQKLLNHLYQRATKDQISVNHNLDPIQFTTANRSRAREGDKPSNGVSENTETIEWDPNKIQWIDAQGPKGAYEKTADQENIHFKLLLHALHKAGGKLNKHGKFYWRFNTEQTIIGRKKQQP
jgi:hypothetical protein